MTERGYVTRTHADGTVTRLTWEEYGAEHDREMAAAEVRFVAVERCTDQTWRALLSTAPTVRLMTVGLCRGRVTTTLARDWSDD